MSYAVIYPIKLAFIVAAPGMLILLFFWMTRAIRLNAFARGFNRRS